MEKESSVKIKFHNNDSIMQQPQLRHHRLPEDELNNLTVSNAEGQHIHGQQQRVTTMNRVVGQNNSNGLSQWEAEEGQLLSYFFNVDGMNANQIQSNNSNSMPSRSLPHSTPMLRYYYAGGRSENPAEQSFSPSIPVSLPKPLNAIDLTDGGETSTEKDLKKNTDKILPPPPQFPMMPSSTNVVAPKNSNNSIQLQHLEWLKSMNEKASSAVQQQHEQIPLPLSLAPIAPPPQLPLSQLNPILSSSTQCATVPQLPSKAVISQSLPITQQQQQTTSSSKEFDDRRARRLARNRESARQSRRRKKELLQSLAAKVSELHSNLETLRRQQINAMVPALSEQKFNLPKDINSNKVQLLQHIVQKIGPHCLVRREINSFQHFKLKQLVLPVHQQFLLWILAQSNDSLFLKPKEEASKHNSNKISSRQIGEKLNQSGVKSCHPQNHSNFWPLLCYEMGFSVDQEEKIIALHKRSPKNFLTIYKTQEILKQLKKGITQHSQKLQYSSDVTYLDTLRPDQAMRLIQYVQHNKSKCSDIVHNYYQVSPENNFLNNGCSISNSVDKSLLLDSLCQKLDQVLKINES